jgi:AcrR family transcriptional regulator
MHETSFLKAKTAVTAFFAALPGTNMSSHQKMLDNAAPGIRERKNILTRRRIAEASLKLYVVKGYDKTTLAEIAREAEISPRTLFLHFANKEETLKYWWRENFTALVPEFLEREETVQHPAVAARSALMALMATQDPAHSATIERLLQSNQTLAMHRHGFSVELEQILFEALCAGWADRHPRALLRTTAMVTVGAMRLAVDLWRDAGTTRPVTDYLANEFNLLSQVLAERPGTGT